jgi:hypothetical protein
MTRQTRDLKSQAANHNEVYNIILKLNLVRPYFFSFFHKYRTPDGNTTMIPTYTDPYWHSTPSGPDS